MVKQVHDNRMVRHLWANQSQSSARSHNGNLSFQDNVLFSYGTPIAAIAKTVDGSKVALITSKTYSMTTSSKHMPRAEFTGPSFYVPNVMHYPTDRHENNLAYLDERYAEALKKYSRTKSDGYRLDYRRQDVRNAARNYLLYARAFGLEFKSVDHEGAINAADIARAEREARANTPQAIARRAKDQARRDAKRTAQQLAERAERERRNAIWAAERAEYERVEAMERPAQIAAWRAGEINSLPHSAAYDENDGALLRVKDDELQTSLGARVPLADAIRVFKRVAECRTNSVHWERNGHTIRVGSFQVDEIFPNGDFRAGCHRINWAESERLAMSLGLIETV